jgi:hypothetical protein
MRLPQILHEETLEQAGPELAAAAGRGLLIGVKLDQGLAGLGPKAEGESVTRVRRPYRDRTAFVPRSCRFRTCLGLQLGVHRRAGCVWHRSAQRAGPGPVRCRAARATGRALGMPRQLGARPRAHPPATCSCRSFS